MPAYIVKEITVSTPSGNIAWFCVINTSTGSEVCRSVSVVDADRICALLIASEE